MKRLMFIFIVMLSIPLIANSALKGDIDENGIVNSLDYILVKNHILNRSMLTGNKLKNADVNEDGMVNTRDYIDIKNIIISGNTSSSNTSSSSTLPKVSVSSKNETCQVVLTANVDSSIKLASKAYSWDNKKTWTSSKTYTVDKIGTYKVYVKDNNNNVYESAVYSVTDINIPTKLKSGIISSSEFNITKGVGSNISKEIARQNTDNFNKALQCAHNNGITSLKVENGKYYFDASVGININFSSITLDLNSSELVVYPNNERMYTLINVENKNEYIYGITIKNGILKGDRYQHKCAKGTWTCNTNSVYGCYRCESDTYPSHEWGHGIKILSKDVRIENLNITDMMGDGIYINTDNSLYNLEGKIYIYQSTIENCRRNGISIINGKNITIKSNTIRNMNGANPQVGIDIERNKDSEFYENVLIEGNIIYGNNRPFAILIHSGIKGYMKIQYNKFGDQVKYAKPEEISHEERARVIVQGNLAYDGSTKCACYPNKVVDNCEKCSTKTCNGRVVNGTVQK